MLIRICQPGWAGGLFGFILRWLGEKLDFPDAIPMFVGLFWDQGSSRDRSFSFLLGVWCWLQVGKEGPGPAHGQTFPRSFCFQPHASPSPSPVLARPKPWVSGLLSSENRSGPVFWGRWVGQWTDHLAWGDSEMCVQTFNSLPVHWPSVNTAFSVPAKIWGAWVFRG